MSYGTKYISGWKPLNSSTGTSGTITNQKENYSGPVTYLKNEPDNFKISYNMENWFNPIVGSSLTMGFLNDASNFFNYTDLYKASERQFKIIVDASDNQARSKRLFDGYVNSDITKNRYSLRNYFMITANNYLNRIDNTYPKSIIDVPNKRSIIDIIKSCLTLTGIDSSIYVNISLEPSGYSNTSTTTALNKTAVDTEVFWKTNFERDGATTILSNLLGAFDAFIYKYDSNIYIERYADLWVNDGSKAYVVYSGDPAISYDFNSNGTAVIKYEPSSNINNLKLLTGTDNIDYIPEVNQMVMTLKQDPYLNLTVNDFDYAEDSSILSSFIVPTKRKWTKFNDIRYGFTNFNIVDGAAIPGYRPFTNYKQISKGVFRYGIPKDFPNNKYHKAYIATKFTATIDEQTSINFKWKWLPVDIGGGITFNHANYEFNWFLRANSGGQYIVYDEETSSWEILYSITEDSSLYYNRIQVKGEDLDKNAGLYQASVDVDFSTVGLLGDQDLVFGIAIERDGPYSVEPQIYGGYPLYVAYGDVVITATGVKQKNTIEADVSTLGYNKQELDLKIFDIENLNNRNGIFTDATYNTRTSLWNDKDSGAYPLSYWVLGNKYQLFRKNRSIVSGDFIYNGFLKPLSMWYDSFDPSASKYILTSYEYEPTLNKYHCEFSEYDNSEMFDAIVYEPSTNDESYYLYLEDHSLSFTYNGAPQDVNVLTGLTTTWTASSNQGWCTVYPDSGGPAGSIEITCSQNPGPGYRQATVTVVSTASAGVYDEVHIVQNPPS